MALEVEDVVDGGVNAEKALCGAVSIKWAKSAGEPPQTRNGCVYKIVDNFTLQHLTLPAIKCVCKVNTRYRCHQSRFQTFRPATIIEIWLIRFVRLRATLVCRSPGEN